MATKDEILSWLRGERVTGLPDNAPKQEPPCPHVPWTFKDGRYVCLQCGKDLDAGVVEGPTCGRLLSSWRESRCTMSPGHAGICSDERWVKPRRKQV
jgi:DNA-directed RNA polymerase subunit RPC12/RpoP